MNKLFSLVLDVSFQGAIAGGIILLVRFLTRKRLSARRHRLLWAILLPPDTLNLEENQTNHLLLHELSH